MRAFSSPLYSFLYLYRHSLHTDTLPYYSIYMKQFPQVIRADILGYCMGVRRAVEAAEQAVRDYPDRPVYTFGPLIHNKSALAALEAQGVQVLCADEVPSFKQKTQDSGPVVIIRAHGVPPSDKDALRANGCTIVDATCPRVLVNQKRAADFWKKGYTVIIAGEKDHGEVSGLAGYCPGCIIVGTGEEARLLAKAGNCPRRAVLISQTTISRAEYDAITAALRGAIADLQVFDTICPATTQRQNALLELRGRVDGILVIGGRNSANTRRLFMTAKECFSHAALIEQPDEIPSVFYELASIGLTAGASTPDSVIDAVEAALLAGHA